MRYRWDIDILNGSSAQTGDTVYGTPPRFLSGLRDRHVVMALWDSKRAYRTGDGKENLSEPIINSFLRTYQNGSEAGHIALALVDAVEQSVIQASYTASDWQSAIGSGATTPNKPKINPPTTPTAIGTVICEGILYVAYTGNNHAYVLRNGELSPLTGEVAQGKTGRSKIKLRTGDRVLLCSEGLHKRMYEAQMAQILIDQKNPVDAVTALLDTASISHPSGNISVGVLYCDPVITRSAILLWLSAVLVCAAIVVGMVWGPGLIDSFYQPGGLGWALISHTTPTPTPEPTPTSSPTAEVTSPAPTATILSPTPTATATKLPSPTPTATPTQTPLPTPTLTPTPTPRRIIPTRTSVPEPTLTPTDVVLPTATFTAQPPPPPPPPPKPTECPPGAICK
jgi:hypothetical protein